MKNETTISALKYQTAIFRMSFLQALFA